MQALALKTIKFPAISLARTSQWISRAQSRAALARLDAAALADIGITTKQARAEARKPFWM